MLWHWWIFIFLRSFFLGVSSCLEGLLSTVTQTLDTSLENSSERNGVECKLCGLEANSAKELVEHRQSKHVRSCTCLVCGKRSRSVSQTWRHMTTHVDKPRASNRTDVECPVCHKLFPSQGKKNFHMEHVHKVRIKRIWGSF